MNRKGRIVVLPVHLDENTARKIERIISGTDSTIEGSVLVAMTYGIYLPCEETPPIRISNRREIVVVMTQRFSEVLRTMGIHTASGRGALASRGLSPAELHIARGRRQ